MTTVSTGGGGFDAEITLLIAETRLLVNTFEHVFSEAFPSGVVPGDQFPAGTANRLMIGTTPLFEAGVSCLAETGTSLGAYAHLRTLIETWAHLDFILNGDPTDSVECRAIRIDLGIADLISDLVQEALTPLSSQDELAKARIRRAAIQVFYGRYGCTGPARTYRSILATLKEMAERLGLDWLLDAYKGSSMVIHGTSFDWSIRNGPDGKAIRVTPTPSHRAARLGHFVLAYNGLGQTTFDLVGITDRRE